MDYYTRNADALFKRYQSLPPEQVHRCWLDLLPAQPGLACDIGAGSGRDAHWLASQGWDVTAVEPNADLRSRAQALPPPKRGSVTWLDDSLPELQRLRALDLRFHLILISAVWMHLPPTQHARAMRIVSELLAPGGLLVVSLRKGPDPDGRFHAMETDALIQHARDRALMLTRECRDQADVTRGEVGWDCVVLRLADDGTGSLPLLRHIIVNDNKSASYKLGLLRVLIRIAEGAPGMVTRRDDDWVEVPFGLVGLYWLRTYMPLVFRHNLIQAPRADHAMQRGYGWARHFYSLQDLSPYDLRIGARFDHTVAPRLVGAINDACSNIEKMPAHYITYPGQSKQVFECERHSVRLRSNHWQITRETLQQFGTFRIPAALWQCFSQFACWLEPAIFNEWVKLMQSWRFQYDTTVYGNAFKWIDSNRDTSKVRSLIQARHAEGETISCVWTQKALRMNSFAVDHCFPWSRWLNNDLWNLLPTTVDANARKGDKLPSAHLLAQARDPILEWWETGYLEQPALREQFYMEAESALPLLTPGCHDIDAVFEAMTHQRTRLKAAQQLGEWSPRATSSKSVEK